MLTLFANCEYNKIKIDDKRTGTKMENSKKLPRVLAVHDLCGFGKCSLATILPVMSACGVEVCPIPTGIFSTNTNFEGFQFTDFTNQMPRFMEHLKEVGVLADGIYSGFLGSAEQIEYIKELVKNFSPSYTIIDPVMGDYGIVYKTYTKEMCEKMKDLVSISDIATPNLTESCILTDTDFKTMGNSEGEIKELAEKIQKIGAKSVVITGIERNGKIYNCILSNGEYCEREAKLLPFRMHGTGDLFAGVLAGGILTGHSLVESVDSAAAFVIEVMEKSKEIEGYHERGACFETLLYKLQGGIYIL